MKRLFIYSDGASKNNGRKNENQEVIGSYAFLIADESNQVLITKSESFKDVTNNQMELYGFISAATNFFKRYKGSNSYMIDVYSDSQYLIKGINEWMTGWKKKNWRNVKNPDLWHIIENIIKFDSKVKFRFFWQKGHEGKKIEITENKDAYFNEMCDSLATETIKNNILDECVKDNFDEMIHNCNIYYNKE